MSDKKTRLVAFVGLFFLLLQAVPALAHGDKVIPQVPDGTGGDGKTFRTKFDLTNLGPDPSTAITKVKVLFFRQNGSPWTLATNLGTASEFTLNLGAFQTLRLETLGNSAQLTAGYAIVRSAEATSIFSEDYEVALTVFYEVSQGGKVTDTVSVPVGQPTVAWSFPVQIDNSQLLYTGFAIVNLYTGSSNSGNSNNITLRLWAAGSTSSANATDGGTATLTLAPNEQRAVFLYPTLFSNQSKFKGMLLGYSDGPVAILALLQTPTASGPQYATMVPSYADALRRNTYMYIRQGWPLDADLPVSDYWANAQDKAPWDVNYVTDTSDTSKRRLEAQSGAGFAVLGTLDNTQFDDNVTIETLRGLDYSTTVIDLSNSSSNLAANFAFAIKTGLGRYVKVRIADVITRQDNNSQPVFRDLALEMYIYK
jgi:hypothetical protein